MYERKQVAAMTDEKKTLKFQMMMSPREAKELDDWMFSHRVRSRAEAIRMLCQVGLSTDRHWEHLRYGTSNAIHAALNAVRVFEDKFYSNWEGSPADQKLYATMIMDAYDHLWRLKETFESLERETTPFLVEGEIEDAFDALDFNKAELNKRKLRLENSDPLVETKER